ncbi:hypothetical protein C450_18624 [Halococcus salifodinae DSM 8989]|uniref:Uncharacterized protein n=1 Tax=Halococcus salifodinae DSM 8989 TaxID=1227456 RepID=M0MTK1_9EURY|nr:hypothetical protein C450_18624 [Halococcus salifodinae DSM 8989]
MVGNGEQSPRRATTAALSGSTDYRAVRSGVLFSAGDRSSVTERRRTTRPRRAWMTSAADSLAAAGFRSQRTADRPTVLTEGEGTRGRDPTGVPFRYR